MNNETTHPLLRSAQKSIGYKFKDERLLLEALTHKSFSNEHHLKYNNERLEYLGDSIIDFVIAYILFEKFPDSNEGLLSRLRAALVNEKELSNIARHIGLNKYIILGRGEQITAGCNKDSILSNAYEAVIAAIFLDSNIERVTKVIKKHFSHKIDNINSEEIIQDYKTTILIYCQERYRNLPTYELISQTGPEHESIFEARIVINGNEYGRGKGRTKKDAEQEAAKAAIHKIVESSNEEK